ncbi:hypothetical protein CAL7102_09137 [Dulcicalothrix desertica PCC 7102]|nr:hypothetical protein CAL7102_09137 [Dulcicalothrix desertica PCC 7102]
MAINFSEVYQIIIIASIASFVLSSGMCLTAPKVK